MSDPEVTDAPSSEPAPARRSWARRRVRPGVAVGVILLAGVSASLAVGAREGYVQEQVERAQAGTLGAERVEAAGLDLPWGVAVTPTEVLVAERDTARILRVGDGAPTELLTVPGVVPGGEGGLLGIAASAAFERDRRLWVYYTTEVDNRIGVVEVPRAPSAEMPDVRVILAGIPKGSIHNGGRLRFGPDGMLYVGTGEVGKRELSQDPRSLGGKILRITPEGAPAPGNPAASSPVWTTGHRNVQGLAFDAQGRLWASELGQNEFDEVNLIEKGANYGWPEVEGDVEDARFTRPVWVMTPERASPSGIAVRGEYLYVAALRGERVWELTLPRTGKVEKFRALDIQRFGRVRSLETGADGRLYLASSNGDEEDQVVSFAPGSAR